VWLSKKCRQRPATEGVMATVSGATNSLPFTLDRRTAFCRESSWCTMGVGITGDKWTVKSTAESHTKSFPTRRSTRQWPYHSKVLIRWISCRSMDVWVAFKLEKLSLITETAEKYC
jgi:hypothetical protein